MVDTMIRLFESTETKFRSNGLGSLPDASRCEVTEERNGSFELELEYHISGKRYPELKLRQIIVAKPNPYDAPQPFRIYSISRPINGLVTVQAEHISYDMSGYPVGLFSASNAADALAGLKEHVITDCPFEFSTDMEKEGVLTVEKPASMRSLLGGSDETVLGVYGGEYEFNVYQVILHKNRGSDRGVTIRYGKNMTDLKQEENCSEVYTAVYPFFWFDGNDEKDAFLVDLTTDQVTTKKTVDVEGTYDFVRVYPLDLSGDWNNEQYEWKDKYPTVEEITAITKKYIENNNIGIPKVSLTVSFEQLSLAGEYDSLKMLEEVHLCDTVHVEFPKLGVSAASQCIKTTYNVLTGRYSSIELGEPSSDLAASIASKDADVNQKLDKVDKEISSCPTKDFMEKAVENATQLITGGLGGYVVMHSSQKDRSYPDEILIMNTPDIETAVHVWRWNKNGLGYSSNGYEGPYETAITQDGQIVADFIKTGVLSSVQIQNGMPEDGEYPFSVDKNGNMKANKATVSGDLYGLDNLKLYNETKNNHRVVMRLEGGGSSDTAKLIFISPDGGDYFVVSEQEGAYFVRDIRFNGHIITPKDIYLEGTDGKAIGLSVWGPDAVEQKRHLIIGYNSSLSGTKNGETITRAATYVGLQAMSGAYTNTATILRGNEVLFKNVTGNVVASDERLKNSLKSLDEFEQVYMDIEPCAFKYNDGTSGRYHFGTTAQGVKKAFESHGYTTQDFGGFVQMYDDPESEDYCGMDDPTGLIYSEFIMWNMCMVQKLYRKVEVQQEEIKKIKNKLNSLKER